MEALSINAQLIDVKAMHSGMLWKASAAAVLRGTESNLRLLSLQTDKTTIHNIRAGKDTFESFSQGLKGLMTKSQHASRSSTPGRSALL